MTTHRPFDFAVGAGEIMRGLHARWGYPPAALRWLLQHLAELLEHV